MKKHLLSALCMLSCLVTQAQIDFGSDAWNTKYLITHSDAEVPSSNWNTSDFDDSKWTWYDGTLDYNGEGDLWIRRTFTYTNQEYGYIYVSFNYSGGPVEIYTNGSENYNYPYEVGFSGGQYIYQTGKNVIATHISKNSRATNQLSISLSVNGDGSISEQPSTPRILIDKKDFALCVSSDEKVNQETLAINAVGGSLSSTVAWKSSNESVVTVANGVVKAVGAGEATVTASTTINGKNLSSTSKVTVYKYAADQKVVIVREPGTLPTLISEDEKDYIENLVLFGELNGTDINYLREMAGNNLYGMMTGGGLAVLDMQNARIVSGGDNYWAEQYSTYSTSTDRISSRMFTKCNSLTEIILPKDIKYIDSYAFQECKNLANVVLSEGLSSIEYYAFSQCPNLAKIEIPASVKNIGSDCFQECKKLAEVIFPENSKIETIGSFAFSNSGIREFHVPASLQKIESYTFSTCRNLESVVFAENGALMSIDGYAFQYCENLSTINIPASLNQIGKNAFYENNSLANLTFAKGSQLMSIDENAFYSCDSLKSIEIPASVVQLGNGAFNFCRNLKSITFAEGSKLSSIGSYAFANQDNLTTFTLPQRVTSIGEEAFWGDNRLSSFTILTDSRLNTIEASAFAGCPIESFYIPQNLSSIEGIGINNSALKTIVVNENNKKFSLVDGCLYYKSNNALALIPQSKEGIFKTPDFMTELPAGALQNCSKLTSVVLSSAITKVGENVFNGCNGLKMLHVLGTTPPIVAANSFEGLNQDKVLVYVPAGQLGAYQATSWNSFAQMNELPGLIINETKANLYKTNDNKLNQIQLTLSAVTSDGVSTPSATWSSSDASIASVSNSGLVSAGTKDGEATITASATLEGKTVSVKCVIKNQNLTGWKVVNVTTAGTLSSLLTETEKETEKALLVMGELNNDDIRVLRYMAGRDEKGIATNGCLEKLNMRAAKIVYGGEGFLYTEGWWRSCGDNYLGDRAFDKCNSLKQVTLPESLTSMESSAFRECTNLEEVVLPESLREISSYAFYGCKSLHKVNIPASVETLSYSAFSGCTSLSGIDLSTASSLSNIYSSCFYGSGLTNIVVPATVYTIGSEAFGYCQSLKTVVFESGSKLSQIDAWAFSSSPALTYLFIQNMTPAEVSSSYFINMNGRPTAYIPVGTLSAYESTAWGSSFNLQEKAYDYGVELSDTEIKVFEMDGEHDRTISAMVFTPNGPLVNNDVEWTSSAPAIASVSASGEVSYVGKGAATITAKTTISGKEYTATCEVTAVDKSLTNGVFKVTAQNDRSGLLEAAGSDEALSNYVHLTLTGTINSYDIFVIRNRMPRLKDLNLEGVSVVANPFEYYTNSHTEANRISDNAFRELNTLETVVLPKTIDYLGNNAFYNCSNLVSVKSFVGLNAIGNSAFSGCSSIKTIELQEGLLSIGGSAFSQCSNLEEINLPSSVYAIDGSAFWYCNSLKAIVLPKNLRAIESYTFYGCSSLESVIIPSNVNRIEYYAFQGCYNLRELRIPPMVENIGDRAFNDCNSIQDVYVYIANPRDIKIDMNTFSCWNTATLHIPNFSYNAYYWDTQWGQFHKKVEFEDKYDQFYTKSTLALNDGTGTIDGTPDATFHAGGGLTVDEVAQNLNKVELKSDFSDGKGASLIASKDGKINVKSLDITIKVSSYKWHFFSFPFDVPLTAIQYEGESAWRRYDGAKRSRREGGWQDLAANETKLEKGRGYIFQGTMDGELKITIENPDLSAKDETTGLFTHESSAPEDANWNFIGNPYTSYYNIDNTTLNAPITIWNGNSYEAYRPGDDDYEFYPFQAFFVQTPEGTTSVGFDADARDTYEQAQASDSPAKAATRASNNFLQNRLFINLTVTAEGDSAYSDKTRIVFNEKQSCAYEASCDAAKFFGNASAIELFSVDATGTQYAINERPEEDGCVDLGIAVHSEGMFTIEAVRMDIPVVLIDHVTKNVHDLSESGYVFSASAGNSKRFTIKVSGNEATGIEEILNNSNTGLKINDTDKLYDLGGRKLNASDKGLMISNGTKVYNQ